MSTDPIAHLRYLAEKHDVCFETWPEYLPVEGRKVRTGIEIDLCGVVTVGEPHICPGCPRCERTYGHLKEIAEWAQPSTEPALSCEILAFDHATHMARGSNPRPEVVLALHLSNEQLFGQISDQDQERCLHAVRDRLAAVGVTQR